MGGAVAPRMAKAQADGAPRLFSRSTLHGTRATSVPTVLWSREHDFSLHLIVETFIKYRGLRLDHLTVAGRALQPHVSPAGLKIEEPVVLGASATAIGDRDPSIQRGARDVIVLDTHIALVALHEKPVEGVHTERDGVVV
jgi:hypothetical protein